jgi:hypothetical protein
MSVNTPGLSDAKVSCPFFESALARMSILVFESFLTCCDVDFVSFAHVVEVELVDITAHVLDFVGEVEDGFVVSVEVPSDLSGSSLRKN